MIIYTRSDEGVSLVIPVSKVNIEKSLKKKLTEQDYKSYILERSVPKDAVEVTEIEDSEIPVDREFRDAWKYENKKIGYNLDKAKEIQLNRIREARAPKLQELDIVYMLAIESGDSEKVSAAIEKKVILRDITKPLINLQPTNIDEIKNAFPDELKN